MIGRGRCNYQQSNGGDSHFDPFQERSRAPDGVYQSQNGDEGNSQFRSSITVLPSSYSEVSSFPPTPVDSSKLLEEEEDEEEREEEDHSIANSDQSFDHLNNQMNQRGNDHDRPSYVELNGSTSHDISKIPQEEEEEDKKIRYSPPQVILPTSTQSEPPLLPDTSTPSFAEKNQGQIDPTMYAPKSSLFGRNSDSTYYSLTSSHPSSWSEASQFVSKDHPMPIDEEKREESRQTEDEFLLLSGSEKDQSGLSQPRSLGEMMSRLRSTTTPTNSHSRGSNPQPRERQRKRDKFKIPFLNFFSSQHSMSNLRQGSMRSSHQRNTTTSSVASSIHAPVIDSIIRSFDENEDLVLFPLHLRLALI